MKAMEDEMKTMNEMKFISKNGIWTLVDLVKGHRIIGAKWVLKKNLKVD